MCIIFLAHQTIPNLPLVIAANRDEFYDRPSMPMQFWDDYPTLLAGRDMLAGGTWLGITRCGRIAVVTNFRDPHDIKEDAPSRGALLTDFLLKEPHIDDFGTRLEKDGPNYNGFNLIYGTHNELHYYSNVEGEVKILPSGVYGLSNHLLDTPWPKISLGKRLLEDLPSDATAWSKEKLFDLLTNQERPHDDHLPDTGIGIDFERVLSSIFIDTPNYGTRCSTVIKLHPQGEVHAEERTYTGGPGQYESRTFDFYFDSDALSI